MQADIAAMTGIGFFKMDRKASNPLSRKGFQEWREEHNSQKVQRADFEGIAFGYLIEVAEHHAAAYDD